MNCPNCGAQYDPSMRNCPSCGSVNPNPVYQAPMPPPPPVYNPYGGFNQADPQPDESSESGKLGL